MELETIKVSLLLKATTHFLVTFIYKWLFPVIITLLTLGFADKERNGFVLFALWLFHLLAYISFPWNYEKPKKENFLYLAKRNFSSIFWTLLQASFLSAFLFIITFIYIIWYFPSLNQYSIILSMINSTLYFLSIVLANFTVANLLNTE
ncbi:MAG: hypothetical protein AABZ00_11495 [Chloroflexota bacterium]